MNFVSRLSAGFHCAYFHALRGAERVLGPRMVFLLIRPEIVFTVVARWSDLAYWRVLRHTLPPSVWKGSTARGHFFRMFRAFISSLLIPLFHDRLGSKAWQQRLTVEGTPPNALPDWDRRPVVLAFMHVGGYALLPCLLRHHGMPASLYIGAVPRLARHARKWREDADHTWEMDDLPQLFCGSKSLPAAMRFLKPGRVLGIALEERDFRQPPEVYSTDGYPIALSRLAFRVALNSGALLMPVTVRECAYGRFKIVYSTPVPDELMREDGLREVNQYLLNQLWPFVRDDPSSLTWTTLEAMSPHLIQRRDTWP